MLEFSLFFFSNYKVESSNKYQLLIEAAKYADLNGFSAVWTPERHFNQFGGLFPNPSVTSAALAMITENIELRCGSIVAPLHDIIRIAEEWSVVDNLSKGRVSMSFASGWNGNDFVLAEDSYMERHKIMYEQIDTLKMLWNGGSVKRKNGLGKEVEIQIFPEPFKKDLTIWITAAGNPATFIEAGEKGTNVLTHLLGQDIQQLAEKIQLYRDARERNGHGRDAGRVAIMLHTYVGQSHNEVMKVVEKPFIEYLRSATNLSKFLYEEAGFNPADIPEKAKELMLRHSFERYSTEAALVGTVESCAELVADLREIGIDEIACLVDFGVERNKVFEALPYLCKLKSLFSDKIRESYAE